MVVRRSVPKLNIPPVVPKALIGYSDDGEFSIAVNLTVLQGSSKSHYNFDTYHKGLYNIYKST